MALRDIRWVGGHWLELRNEDLYVDPRSGLLKVVRRKRLGWLANSHKDHRISAERPTTGYLLSVVIPRSDEEATGT